MKTSFVFFGTSRFSVILLEELKNRFQIVPSLIVSTKDMPVGRKQILTSSPVSTWAKDNKIETLKPDNLKDPEFIEKIKSYSLFIVASYGKIIPKVVLDIPSLGTLNVHPSLLPKYRGASPIQYQILKDEEEIGTTIMLMDEQMDHGPIVSQKNINKQEIENLKYNEVEELLAKESATLLYETLSGFIEKKINLFPQNHNEATYTKIIKKEDGEIFLDQDPHKIYLKYLAFHTWPKIFFFTHKDNQKNRVIVTDATYKNGILEILKVIPEGKKEMDYQSFLIGLK